MELILVRHAEPAEVDARDPRAGDPPLGPRGRRQAEAVADWLAPMGLDAIVSGPARRARETADALAARIDRKVDVDDRLRDAEDGTGHYVPIERDRALDPAGYAARMRAYRTTDRLARIAPRVLESIAAWTGAMPGGRLAVFCHGSIVNVYAADVLGLGQAAFLQPAYASGHRFLISSAGVRSVRSFNETAYLRDLPSESTA